MAKRPTRARAKSRPHTNKQPHHSHKSTGPRSRSLQSTSAPASVPFNLTDLQEFQDLQRTLASLPPDDALRLVQAVSLPHYLSTLSVVHPIEGRVPWLLYPYQTLLASSQESRRLIVKARQTGVSQYIAGEALHRAKFHPEREQIFISRNALEARKLISYVRILASEDPDLGNLEGVVEVRVPSFKYDLTPATHPYINQRLTSKIVSEAASQSAGRGGGKLAIYVDEFAHGNFRFWGKQIWQSVTPGVALGGSIVFISTPQGKGNTFYRLYSEAVRGLSGYKVYKIVWYDCPAYNPLGFHLEDPLERKTEGEKGNWFQSQRTAYDDAAWAEEYECDFVMSAGLVYGAFDEQVHVGSFNWNPNLPTYACQDFGFINPAVALLVQVTASDEVYVLQERYHTLKSIGELAKTEYLPLAKLYKVRRWICDPASPGEVQELKNAGIPAVGAKRIKVEDGIAALRKLVRPPGGGPPKLFVDSSCNRLITDLTTYAYKPDSDEPEKDVADHGPDALRYFITEHFGVAKTGPFITGGDYVSHTA